VNILITGSNGNLGRVLVRKLLEKNHLIIGIDKSGSENYNINSNYLFINKDILGHNVMNDIYDITNNKMFKIDKIVHLASYVGSSNSRKTPDIFINNNIGCTTEILKYMMKAKIKDIIFASSSSIYRNIQDSTDPIKRDLMKISGITEDFFDSRYISSPYSASKVASEIILESYKESFKIRPVILRFFDMYHHSFKLVNDIEIPPYISILIKLCIQAFIDLNIVIEGTGSTKFSFLNMEDAANIIIEILESEKEYNYKYDYTYNVSGENGSNVDLNQLIRKIQLYFSNKKLKLIYKLPSVDEKYFLGKTIIGNNRKIKLDYGFKPKANIEVEIGKIIDRLKCLGVEYLNNVFEK
jgi:nucleoside-diphosphate-sugar epimerase